jgi:hypothetical protein
VKAQLAIGSVLVAGVTVILVGWWGRVALIPAVAFGALALAIEVSAVLCLRPALNGPFSQVMKRRGVGMAMRLGGIGLFVAAVVLNRELFPPLPTAFGYLGVLIPLLFLEPRFLR